ncbi:MAG: ABC transporter ATP-binding protein [bacterium]
MPLIEASNISKRYSPGKILVQVLSGASLAVEPGETVAIVGRSGAGKSTLLHILGGLDAPDTGTVTFKGRSLYHPDGPSASPVRASIRERIAAARFRTGLRARHIGFVFQAYHLLPELTVLENTILPSMAAMSEIEPGTDIRQRAMELLAAVGLSQRADHMPLELSGGEQQRLALARALMNNPELVLADEPTGNLDETTGAQVLDVLFGLSKTRKRTVILVTHNEKVASQCNRVLRLADGHISED